MKNLCSVHTVALSPCFGIKTLLCRKYGLGCLIVVDDSESRYGTSVDALDRP